MKKFCEDCKWASAGGVFAEDRCMHSSFRTAFVVNSRSYAPKCESVNEKGECVFYELKWWKFWRSGFWRNHI